MTVSFVKDPSARKDYQVEWADWLAGDTISVSTWTVPSGLTLYATSNTSTAGTIWLEGGTAPHDYLVTNQIASAGGRIDQRSFKILCREL